MLSGVDELLVEHPTLDGQDSRCSGEIRDCLGESDDVAVGKPQRERSFQ